MQSDKMEMTKLKNQISEIFRDVFGEDILFIESNVELEHMGYFKFQYQYCPLGYDIFLENERNLFTIRIQDDEGAIAPLYGIECFNNQMSMENIRSAVKKLRDVLQKNEFCFCIRRDGKLYQKKGEEYRRVRENADVYRDGNLYKWRG